MQQSEAFQSWVRGQGGESAVAEKLGVTRAAVHKWCARQGWPGVASIRAILRLARGKLSFEEILDSTAPLPAHERRAQGRPKKDLQ